MLSAPQEAQTNGDGPHEVEEQELRPVGRGGLPHYDREGKPILRVDAHTHILMEDWPSLRDRYGYGGFIRLEHHTPGRAKMFKDDGTFFREIEDNCWCVAGNRLQVTILGPPFLTQEGM